MNVAIIGTNGLPANYGGWETLVTNIVESLSLRHKVTVYCSSKSYSEKLATYKGARLEYLNLKANGIQSIFYDFISMLMALKNNHAFLILGTSGCVFIPVIRLLKPSLKIVVNIDGLEWRRQKWGFWAKKFLRLSEKFAVKFSHKVISDNKVIQDYILEAYHKNSELIAYGGDHVTSKTVEITNPQKNMILDTFSDFTDLNLVIVGNWSNSAYGEELRQQYQIFSNIYMLDPIYDQFELDSLRSNCYVYIHGHSAGGTNPSLVEAMYMGLPVIAYDVNFNRETTASSALYFSSKERLVELFSAIDETSMAILANNLKNIALERYTWHKIAGSYLAVLESCLNDK